MSAVRRLHPSKQQKNISHGKFFDLPRILLVAVAGALAQPLVAEGSDTILWNKLGNLAEVQTSEIGPPGIVTGALEFAPVAHGNGVALQFGTSQVKFNQIFGKAFPDAGTIEFWWIPGRNENSSTGSHFDERFAFVFSSDQTLPNNFPEININLAYSGNYSNRTRVIFQVDEPQRVILEYDLNYLAGDLIHVAITWDKGLGSTPVKTYFNGVEGTVVANFSQSPEEVIQRIQNRIQNVGYAYDLELLRFSKRPDGAQSQFDSMQFVDNLKVFDVAKTSFDDRFTEGFPPTFNPKTLSVGDINGDGGQDSSVVEHNDASNRAQATIKALNGTILSQFDFTANLRPVDTKIMADINNNGAPEFVFLGTGSVKTEVRDSLTGQLQGSATFNPNFQPIDLEIVPDQNGNGIPELAVLQKGSTRVEVRDALNGAWITSVGFNASYVPKDLVVLPNVGQTAAPDLAVLMENTNPHQHDRVEIRDLQNKQLVRNVFVGKGFEVRQLEMLEDINNNNTPELGVLREGSANVLVKDAGTGGTIRNVGFNAAFTPQKLLVVPDTDNDGEQELGLLSRNPNTGSVKIELRDINGGQLTRNVWYGTAETPLDADVYEDINGNGSAELGVLGRVNSNPGQLKLRIKDARTGAHVRAILF